MAIRSAEITTACFEALGRSAHLADWQNPEGRRGFDQAQRSPQGEAAGGAAESIPANKEGGHS
jgi:hypothetical protein